MAFADVAEGFTLAIAEFNFASDGDLIVQALQNRAIAEVVQFIVLDFGGRESFSFLDAVKTEMQGMDLQADHKPVLLVRGLETVIGVKGYYPNFLRDLNYSRDQLAAQIPYPMVLFLPEYAVSRLAQYAKDFWTWKSGLFHFRTTHQTVESVQTQLAQPDHSQPADSRLVKQSRIEQLERLLSEHTQNGYLSSQSHKTDISLALELGDAYRSLSDYEQARRYYHKARDWAEAENDLLQQASALFGLGQVHRLRIDNIKARARFEQAMELYRAVGARLGEANVLQEQGKMEQDPEKSLQLLQQAQSMYEAISDGYSQCRNLVKFLAEAQLAAGQQATAVRSLQCAADLALGTEFEFFRETALKRLQELERDSDI